MLHVLLLTGTLALPAGLLILTGVQILLMRRFPGRTFNFLTVLQLGTDLLTPKERLLRRCGSGLMAVGLLLVILTGTALFFGWGG